MTPVESTSTSSEVEVEEPRRLGRGREGVELPAFARRRVRDARVDHDRLRVGEREVLAVHRQAGGLHAVAREHRRPRSRAGPSGRSRGRGGRGRRIPAATPEATNPLAAVTLNCVHVIPARSRAAARRVGSRPSARFAFCTACPAAPLPRLSIAQMTIVIPVEWSAKTPISAASVPCTRADLGLDPLRQHAHDRAVGVGLLDQRSRIGVGAEVTRREQASAHGQQVRHERDLEAELLRDLGAVAVRADRVRREVLEHGARVRAVLERPPGARHARFRVDDHVAVDDLAQRGRGRAARRSRSSRGSRSAAPRRDAPRAGRSSTRPGRGRTSARRAPGR